jgi:hypothetical protein
MPFTFKLAKRLALSKAVRTTAARALPALCQVYRPIRPSSFPPPPISASRRREAHHIRWDSLPFYKRPS